MEQGGFDDLFKAPVVPKVDNPFDESDNPFADIRSRAADPWAAFYNEQPRSPAFKGPASSGPPSPTTQREHRQIDEQATSVSGAGSVGGEMLQHDGAAVTPAEEHGVASLPRPSTFSPPFREVYEEEPAPSGVDHQAAAIFVEAAIPTAEPPSSPRSFSAPFPDIISSRPVTSPSTPTLPDAPFTPLSSGAGFTPTSSASSFTTPPQERKSTAALMSALLPEEASSTSPFRKSSFKPPPTPRKRPPPEQKAETPRPAEPKAATSPSAVTVSAAPSIHAPSDGEALVPSDALPGATPSQTLPAPPPPEPALSNGHTISESNISAVVEPRATEMDQRPPSEAASVTAQASIPVARKTAQPDVSAPLSPSDPSSEATSAMPSAVNTPAITTPASAREAFLSPLEAPFSGRTNVERTFSSLTLGGADDAGWHASPSALVTSVDPIPETAEDAASLTSPEGQSVPRLTDPAEHAPSLAAVPSKSKRRIDPSRPAITITVGDPQKVGDPIKAHIVYTVHTKTDSPNLFRNTSFSVLRRYSDFLWLYEALCVNNPGVIVPPVPEKHSFGRFEEAFVESRRLALNKCIQKIVDHPLLYTDAALKLFLESDSFAMDIKHHKSEAASERAGLMSSIGSTLTGPKFLETDEWFENRKTYLDSLESQLRALVKAVDLLSKQRAELSTVASELSESLAVLAASGLSKQLSQSLAMLADVEGKVQELQEAQAKDDVVSLLATVDEYTRLIGSVRLAFASRTKIYTSWQNAEADVRRTRAAHEKAKRQGKLPTDRTGVSLAELGQTERRALDAKQEFDSVTRLIKVELNRFERERVEDFKESLDEFLEGMIRRQRVLIRTWEDYQGVLLKRSATNPQQNGAASRVPREP